MIHDDYFSDAERITCWLKGESKCDHIMRMAYALICKDILRHSFGKKHQDFRPLSKVVPFLMVSCEKGF
jgi:hypothetical protein